MVQVIQKIKCVCVMCSIMDKYYIEKNFLCIYLDHLDHHLGCNVVQVDNQTKEEAA